jgi:hypothetical protein
MAGIELVACALELQSREVIKTAAQKQPSYDGIQLTIAI